MQDIPRNELLDKLADGWKLRRKSWAKECTIGQSGGTTTTHWVDLLKNDWEGEPPEVKCLSGKLHMVAAFALLQEGTVKFIRRPSWDKCKLFKHSVMCFALNYEDIQTSDWEVWA